MDALGSVAGAVIGIGAGTKWGLRRARLGIQGGRTGARPPHAALRARRSTLAEETCVRGGRCRVDGPGSPKDDAVPAVIDGTTPAALSDGEYVIKAESVDQYGPRLLAEVNDGKAEIIPSEVLTEAGRNQVRALVLALAAPVRPAAARSVAGPPRTLATLQRAAAPAA